MCVFSSFFFAPLNSKVRLLAEIACFHAFPLSRFLSLSLSRFLSPNSTFDPPTYFYAPTDFFRDFFTFHDPLDGCVLSQIPHALILIPPSNSAVRPSYASLRAQILKGRSFPLGSPLGPQPSFLPFRVPFSFGCPATHLI